MHYCVLLVQYKSGVFASTGSSKNRQKHPKAKTPDFLKFPRDFSSTKCTFYDTIKQWRRKLMKSGGAPVASLMISGGVSRPIGHRTNIVSVKKWGGQSPPNPPVPTPML